MKLLESRERPSAARIARLEQQLGQALPDDYRAFLLGYNGGRPEPGDFAIPALGDRSHVARFLALDGRPSDDLDTFRRRYAGRVPAGWLPVAYDDLGNLLLLSLVGPRRGRVFFWDHEAEAGETGANVSEVAEGFAAFAEGLR